MDKRSVVTVEIIERNGTEENFDNSKIVVAMAKANTAAGKDKLSLEQIRNIVGYVEYKCVKLSKAISAEEIQDMVENQIMSTGAFELVKDYMRHCYQRFLTCKANTTDSRILFLIEYNNEDMKQESSNKNPTVNSMQRDCMAGEVSKDLTKRMLPPQDIVEVDRGGIIHFYDSDYFAQYTRNCDLVDLGNMLQNSMVTGETRIEKLHSSSTACNITTQIIIQVASDQYGGQNTSLAHLIPFVDVPRKKTYAEVQEEVRTFGCMPSKKVVHGVAENRLRKEATKGVQTIQYQVITLMTIDGQAPFLTVLMYLSKAKDEWEKKDLVMIIGGTLKQRCQDMRNESGVWITPTFPRLIYVLEEGNVNKGTEYYCLAEMAAKRTTRRLIPDHIPEKKTMELEEGGCLPVMGRCSTSDSRRDESGNYKFYSRSNQGMVTINLVGVALSSSRGMEAFWKIFGEKLDLCYRALMCRHNRLRGTLSDAAPILWQNGAPAKLKKGETIDRLLYGGYSTISLDYMGLYECVKHMIGKSHIDRVVTPFALEVMEYMSKACNHWKDETNIRFSICGSPIESTTYKFTKYLQKRSGTIEGVTDRSYITSSCHVNVSEEIGAFSKLRFESRFQVLFTGGVINYVGVPNIQNNIPIVPGIIRYIYDNIMYAGLNTESDFYQGCGFNGEVQIMASENGKLVWECPKCGNRDENELSVVRRTHGYIGTQPWNQGRTQKIRERVLHLQNELRYSQEE